MELPTTTSTTSASLHRIRHLYPESKRPRRCRASGSPSEIIDLNAALAALPAGFYEYLDGVHERRNFLYLAYGSNLSVETFRGQRGIRPISQVNVQVPSLRLTFDLPGIPYAEPCFANSGLRDPADNPVNLPSDNDNEKTPLLTQSKEKYRKDRWHKGLIGVVYEVTPEDYVHIIATEGGGAAYRDVEVLCHPFASSDPSTPVPQNPALPPFKAHTLFAPADPEDTDPPRRGGRLQRPNASYAQPSARYLKLIRDGAAELGLPYEYQDFLASIHPYTISTNKQRVGQYVFLSIWLPIIVFVFALTRTFEDKNGRLPRWATELAGAIFKGVWASYDSFFKPIFGDGERSIPDGGDDVLVREDEEAQNASGGPTVKLTSDQGQMLEKLASNVQIK